MGAYSPVSIATPDLLGRVRRDILLPTLAELGRQGAPFAGVLYAGLMISADGRPRVVEFNCRFGDPETQAVLPLVSGGLFACIEAITGGRRPSAMGHRPSAFAVTTVLASRGYPEKPEKGAAIPIPGILPDGVSVFHAGTTRDAAGTLRTAGGRVLNVTAVAATFREAQRQSRAAADAVAYEGKVFRRDIGWREALRSATRVASGVTP